MPYRAMARRDPKGFDLTFVTAEALAKGIVSLAPSVPWSTLADICNRHLASMRAKEVTIKHCKDCFGGPLDIEASGPKAGVHAASTREQRHGG